MIDDKIDRHQRIDLLRIAAKFRHRVAHRSEIDDRRHPGEILHQNPGGPERDFALGRALVGEPRRDALDVALGDGAAILEAQQILKQDLHRERQRRHAGKPMFLRRLEREIMVGLGAYRELFAAFETVERGHRNFPGGLI